MAGTATTTAFSASAVSASTRAAIGWGTDLQGRRADARPARRPLRLTRRGRIVRMIVLVALAWIAVGVLAATASHAERDAGPLPTAVVQKHDTLWDIAARYRPGEDPFAMVEEIRALNDLPGYTIHPGQELRLPRGR